MIAAIYARKSTKQDGVVDDEKAVGLQQDMARAFALTQGWTVDERYVFVDDGISGAEFEKRPAFMRMMGLAEHKAPFQRLIVSEQKSIGREASETGYRIKQLALAGVEIVEYTHGRCLTPKNWLDKAMNSVQSAADEAHQRETSARVMIKHGVAVDKGHCVGGRVYGYRNANVLSGLVDDHGRPIRSHVTREMDPERAPVVLRIFEMYDSGLGLKAIAKTLTRERVPGPIPFKRKDGWTPTGWSASTVGAILGREMYAGIVVWNKSRKRNDWGQRDPSPRPESEWKRIPDERLRIVPEELWQRVASRRRDTEGRTLRFESGRISGRPPAHAIKNLLAGLAKCGLCGGGMVAETSARKRGRATEYLCHGYRHNGTCENALRVPADEMNEAVLQAIEEHALTPEAVEQVILWTEKDDVQDQRETLSKELQSLQRRKANVMTAIEEGGQVGALVARLQELEGREREIARLMANLQPVPRLAPDVIENRLAEWRRLLRQSITQGRAVLQRVLQGRITFTPNGAGYTFTAPTRFDKLFTGIVSPRPAFVAVGDARGTEHLTPGDTRDQDYGELLERVCGKGLASPTGFEPVFWP